MKLKVTEELRALNGESLFDVTDGRKKNLTLGAISVDAILRPFEADQNVSGVEKMARWDLAQRIYKATDETDISSEEAVLLKNLIARAFPVMVAGQACKIIDGSK
jgi:hypothetical protein